ncbi:MAG TPA: hypothetical protein VF720_02520 [Candidatus Eisenbacteria bacterium]
MKRWLSIAVVALACLPPLGSARGDVSLGWNDVGPAMTGTQTFDCGTNEGADTLVAAFRAPGGVTKLLMMEAVVDFCAGPTGLPEWWRFDGCRAGALSATTTMGPLQVYFGDYWQGRGDVDVDFSLLLANTGRIVVTITLDPEEAGPLQGSSWYYAFRLVFDHRKTVGQDACDECERPACFVLNDVRLVWPEGETRLHNDFNGVSWQSPLLGCPFIVPVEPSTWSGIKTLFD